MANGAMRLSLRSYDERPLTHAHDFDQIVFPVAGRLESRIGGAVGCLSGDCMAVIARGTTHTSRAMSANRFVVLDVREAPAFAGPAFRRLDGRLGQLVSYVDAELSAGTLAADTEFHLASLLVARIRRQDGSRTATPIGRALALIAEAFGRDIGVSDMARAAGLRPSRFHDLFLTETGTTPAAMLREVRLRRAADLLRLTDMPIAEIALAVGFSDQTALTRCFRQSRGTTPDALRRRGRATPLSEGPRRSPC